MASAFGRRTWAGIATGLHRWHGSIVRRVVYISRYDWLRVRSVLSSKRVSARDVHSTFLG